ncbi:hypothetical protein V6N13_016839 [Hibiscus sabdariffa]|uniref:PGG domain-containing protein n=1 Tax=Hibiscus sabdariffa TaxID=183260 RepID=A0ABR2PU73_9ROSI
MDESLRASARTGNISELYRLIERDGNILRRFDEVEFVDTPLHIAAKEGCIGFTMEIMNLKPSFARKLNHQGLSPIHLAVQNGHTELVLWFLEIDKDLVRVRLERKGRKKDYYREVMNQKDEDGNTALHRAASSNQPQVLELLLESKADKHVTNQDGLTALDLAHQHNNKESINIMRSCFCPRVSDFKYKLKKQIVDHTTMASSLFSYDTDNISGDDRNALLVILGLLLTATYQATLSPPSGVLPVQSSSTSTDTSGNHVVDKLNPSELQQTTFLMFYIPTYIVFLVAFFLTLALLKPFPQGFRTALQILLAFLAIGFVQSICLIAPPHLLFNVITIVSILFWVLIVFMLSAHRVSKLGVTIVGCCLSPAVLFFFSIENIHFIYVGFIIQGCWLFLFMHDEFWEGTMLVIGYCFFFIIVIHEH